MTRDEMAFAVFRDLSLDRFAGHQPGSERARAAVNDVDALLAELERGAKEEPPALPEHWSRKYELISHHDAADLRRKAKALETLEKQKNHIYRLFDDDGWGWSLSAGGKAPTLLALAEKISGGEKA